MAASDLRSFAHLTFPAYRHLLSSAVDARALRVASSAPDGRPAGLALGVREGEQARLLSLQIGRGASDAATLEATLLRRFAQEAQSGGAARVVASLPLAGSDVPSPPATALGNHAWRRAGDSTIVMRTTIARLSGRLGPHQAGTDATLALEPWSFAWPDPAWSPPELAPSRFAPRAPDGRPLSRSASFAVVGAGELHGWLLCHDLGEGWLRLTSHYLRPGPAATREFAHLWTEFFRRTERQGWSSITFSASSRHPVFHRFCHRKIAPVCDWWRDSADHEIASDVLAA